MKNKDILLSKKIGYVLFCLLGVLCAFLWKAEKDLASYGNILWDTRYLLEIVMFSAFFGVLVGGGVCFWLYAYLEGKIKGRIVLWFSRAWKGNLSVWKVWGLVFSLIVVCYLPIYFAYYPGILSYDITFQLDQIVLDAYNDHHPIAHTLLFQAAMNVGRFIWNDANIGVGLYVLLQMLFLAGVFAYGITILYKQKVSKVWTILTLIYSMFYPFHWYLSISSTKDILFSAFFMLQIVSFYVLLLQGESFGICNQHVVLFFLGTVGMVIFRNNGKYAMLIFVIFQLIALWKSKRRKMWAKLLAYSGIGLVVGCIVVNALFYMTNAQQGDKREMLSMPIQQLARCMIYHGGVEVLEEDDNSMDAESKALINEFLLGECYKNYRASISDPVKKYTNTYVVRYRIKEFITTYVKLFLQYPGDYINAALATNAGYLSPSDVTHAVINEKEEVEGLGYVQTFWSREFLSAQGLHRTSFLPGLLGKLEKWADGNEYLNIPLLKYLFVPGIYFWIYLFLTGKFLVQKKYGMLVPMMLIWGYYATLLLGPTVQLRYLYPVMIVLPYVFLLGSKRIGASGSAEEKN